MVLLSSLESGQAAVINSLNGGKRFIDDAQSPAGHVG